MPTLTNAKGLPCDHSTDEVAQVLAALVQRLGRHFELHTEHKCVRTLQQRAGENEWQAYPLLLYVGRSAHPDARNNDALNGRERTSFAISRHVSLPAASFSVLSSTFTMPPEVYLPFMYSAIAYDIRTH